MLANTLIKMSYENGMRIPPILPYWPAVNVKKKVRGMVILYRKYKFVISRLAG
jgi:hypothetical protein